MSQATATECCLVRVYRIEIRDKDVSTIKATYEPVERPRILYSHRGFQPLFATRHGGFCRPLVNLDSVVNRQAPDLDLYGSTFSQPAMERERDS
jgi:hypothetical protein